MEKIMMEGSFNGFESIPRLYHKFRVNKEHEKFLGTCMVAEERQDVNDEQHGIISLART